MELEDDEAIMMKDVFRDGNKTIGYNLMRENAKGNETFSVNPTFSMDVEVNMNQSFVHVPTNVHARSAEMRSIIKWTSKLDQVFR